MKFKVGDRVRVYYGAKCVTNATVLQVTPMMRVKDETPEGYDYDIHPKQCRRLVKKKKPETKCETCGGAPHVFTPPPKTVTMWAPVMEDARQQPGVVPIWNVSDSIFRTKELAFSAKHDTAFVVAVVAVQVEMRETP